MCIWVRLPLDTVVTMLAVMKLGKIKQDNVSFKKSIPNNQVQEKGQSTALWVSGGLAGCSTPREAAGSAMGRARPSVVVGVAEDGAGRQTEVLCVSRSWCFKQPLPSECGLQLQILRSNWGTIFNIFTWNKDIKMPFWIRLQILLLHAIVNV